MTTLTEYMKLPPEPPNLLSCGHPSDYFDQEAQYKLGGNRVCADCYFDAFDDIQIGRASPHGCGDIS